MMQEIEFKKILEVQKGVALLREMREKQENIRIEQEILLNERLQKEITKPPPQQLRNNNLPGASSKTEVVNLKKGKERYGGVIKPDHSLIIENPSDEDRESFPFEDKPKKNKFNTIADDEKKEKNFLMSQNGIKSSLAKISLIKP